MLGKPHNYYIERMTWPFNDDGHCPRCNAWWPPRMSASHNGYVQQDGLARLVWKSFTCLTDVRPTQTQRHRERI